MIFTSYLYYYYSEELNIIKENELYLYNICLFLFNVNMLNVNLDCCFKLYQINKDK